MARASKLTAPFLAATLLVASALPMRSAFAEEAAPNGTGANARATPTATVTPANDSRPVTASVQQNPPPVMIQAGDYSRENGAIAIYVLKGTDMQKYSATQIGDILTQVMNKNGVETVRAFVEETEQNGAVVSYFIEGHKYGPYSLQDSVAIVPHIVDEFRVSQLAKTRAASLDRVADSGPTVIAGIQ